MATCVMFAQGENRIEIFKMCYEFSEQPLLTKHGF